MDWLRDHPLIALRLAVVLIALIAGAFVHRRRRGLKWASQSGAPSAEIADAVGLAGGSHTLHHTAFVIWNDGRNPIVTTDVSSADPLRIEAAEGASILYCKVNRQWGPWVGAHAGRISGEHRRVPLAFSLLQPNDGFLVNAYHAGPSREMLTLRGAPANRRIRLIPASPGEAEGPLKQMKKFTEEETPGLPDHIMKRHGGP